MPKNNSKQMRDFRRSEAEKRQTKHLALSLNEKIEKINSRPGASDKELKRLFHEK